MFKKNLDQLRLSFKIQNLGELKIFGKIIIKQY